MFFGNWLCSYPKSGRFQSLRVHVMQESEDDLNRSASKVTRCTTGTLHVMDFIGPVLVPIKSHYHSVFVWAKAAGNKPKKKRNAGEHRRQCQYSSFSSSSETQSACCKITEQRGKRKASVKATTGSSFRATPTYPSQCRDVLLRFSPPHKLSLYTRTHTHTHLPDKYWHTQGLTLTRADIVKSDF